jgi:hypothetical protein
LGEDFPGISPASAAARQAGEVQSFGSRGVWVLPGLTAEMVMAGAEYIEREFGDFEIPHYTARSMASEVYTVMDSKRSRSADRTSKRHSLASIIALLASKVHATCKRSLAGSLRRSVDPYT